MKKAIFAAAVCLPVLFGSCRKQLSPEPSATPFASASPFTEFVILHGRHSTAENVLKEVETTELKFLVKFDSSAIYQTANPENQHDINKLYGFSDNGHHHHQFSARFGWRWSDGALRLFAYTYNNGVREWKELGTLGIGAEGLCSIKAAGEVYVFTLNNTVVTMPRQSTTQKGKGYRLYPYFGGDEPAPHDVHIWIREA